MKKKSGADPKLDQRTGQAQSPKIPGRIGGRLIRRVIADLRKAEIPLPLGSAVDSQILIACSGGLDSVALAMLIAQYGKRIARDVRLLHINHGWRGRQSDEDARWVVRLAESLDINCIQERLDPRKKPPDRSLEEWARTERKRLYRKHAGPKGVVLTGHQADELCETLAWRLFTGAASTHGRGILVQEGIEVRPLLGCYKSELRDFLVEEGASWREDPSNRDPTFLRARFRERLCPELDLQFPRWKEHLLHYAGAGKSSRSNPSASEPMDWLAGLFGGAGVRVRREHWERIQTWLDQMQKPEAPLRPAASSRVLDSMDLESGWTLRLERREGADSATIAIERHDERPRRGRRIKPIDGQR